MKKEIREQINCLSRNWEKALKRNRNKKQRQHNKKVIAGF